DVDEEDMKIEISKNDSINSVIEKINDKDNHVRASYDTQTKKVFLETTRTGEYHEGGKEIEFDDNEGSFFESVLGLKQEDEEGGTDASFTYNGKRLTSKDNSYELNDITFDFKDETDGSATISVTNNTDDAFDSIMDYIEEYND